MIRYIVFCTERDQETPNLVIRFIDATSEEAARERVEDYHDGMDGNFRILSIYTVDELHTLADSAETEDSDL